MPFHTRLFACLLFCAAAALAQEFPARPMRIVVPNPPGGTVDLVARVAARGMTSDLGQNTIVEVKPGGNNIIGTDAVARAAADGYTILMAGTHLTINPLERKLPYDGLNAFAPVALLASTPLVIAVHPSVPARSIKELVDLAKSRPGELNCASSNPGSAIHLAVERFRRAAGIDVNYIPYQGGIQAVMAVVAGHAGLLIAPLSDAAAFIDSGKLRALAVTSLERSERVKEVPTLSESGFPGFQQVQWFGAVVPAGTPKPVIAKLSRAMLRAAASADARFIFDKAGMTPATLGPEEFKQFLQDETRAFAAIIREGNIKAD